MVKITNMKLDMDKSYKYGCNNDNYEKYSYRCGCCGCKCHKKSQLDTHFELCKERLVNSLEFLLRDDTTHLNKQYFIDNFDINPLTLINKINDKFNEPQKPQLIHTSESISYKKSENLIPLNDYDDIIDTFINNVSTEEDIIDEFLNRQIINDVYIPKTEDDIEIKLLNSDKQLNFTESQNYKIKLKCEEYINNIYKGHYSNKFYIKIRFKKLNNGLNKNKYIKIIHNEWKEEEFKIESINKEDKDYLKCKKNKHNYYEIEL